jgi:hypothetical protein
MRLRAALLVAAMSMSHLTAGASPPVPIKLADLYSEAQIVGVFEITEGKIVSPDGRWCGARYKARAVEGIKNASTGAVLEFGYLPNLKIGTAYLLVLGQLEPPPPTFQSEEEFLTHCKPQLPAANVIGLWRGAMEIEGDTRDRAKRSTWTVQPVGYVTYPIGTRTARASGERRFWYADLVKRLVGEQ